MRLFKSTRNTPCLAASDNNAGCNARVCAESNRWWRGYWWRSIPPAVPFASEWGRESRGM